MLCHIMEQLSSNGPEIKYQHFPFQIFLIREANFEAAEKFFNFLIKNKHQVLVADLHFLCLPIWYQNSLYCKYNAVPHNEFPRYILNCVETTCQNKLSRQANQTNFELISYIQSTKYPEFQDTDKIVSEVTYADFFASGYSL